MSDQIPDGFSFPSVAQNVLLEELLTDNETASGSYDLRGVRATTFGKLLQALPIPTLLLNRSHTIMFANQAWAKLGPEWDNILGLHFSALFFDPQTADSATDLVREVFFTRRPLSMEAVLGIERASAWGRVSLRCLRVGRDRHLLVLVEDLTLEKKQILQNEEHQRELRKSHDELEQRNRELRQAIARLEKAEAELKVEKKKFQTLAEESPIGMVLVGEDGRFQYVNPPFQELLGSDLSEIEDGRGWCRKVRSDGEFPYEVISAWLRDLKMSEPGDLRERSLSVTCTDGTEKVIQFRPVQLDTGQQLVTCEDITERKRAEDEIRASLREKELLLREIHRRVKNNLQIISSLLSLQSHYAGGERCREMFRNTESRVRSLSLVHETLYQSEDLESIRVDEFFRNVVGSAIYYSDSNMSRIRLHVNVEEASFGIDTALPCALIIDELVTNSMKHAFPDDREGEIRIWLRSLGDGEFELLIGDNGVGLPEHVDLNQLESLGLELVMTFVEQLHGSIELSRDCGTEFRIRFRDVKSQRSELS